MARYLDLPAIVLVPSVVPAAAVERIRGEGAEVHVVDAPYDDTVREAAALCDGSDERILVQDTSWPGYEVTPRWIVDGYATLFTEATAQLVEAGVSADAEVMLVVPAGVGSLAHAAVLHCRRESALAGGHRRARRRALHRGQPGRRRAALHRNRRDLDGRPQLRHAVDPGLAGPAGRPRRRCRGHRRGGVRGRGFAH